MVGELVMGAGQFDFWHVAVGAIFRCHFAEFCARLTAGVTGLAFRIVVTGDTIDIFVRIVASGTGDTLVIHVKTLAVSKTIRLEPHVANTVRAVLGNTLRYDGIDRKNGYYPPRSLPLE